jgi:DNA-binding NarL/FixJ family response regulator
MTLQPTGASLLVEGFAPSKGLPIGAREESQGARSGAECRQNPTRILIVEDDFLIAMQTEDALTDAGFKVVGIAATAEEAIALAREQRPVLVVMDIRLAGKRDGIDAAKDLFTELNIRCIFATAHDDPHTRQRAAPYAPLGWLAKPYTMASLVTMAIESRANLD